MIFLLMLVLVPVFIAMTCMPYWTRKTECFGVTIPEDVSQIEPLKKLRKSYVFVMSLFSLITMVIFLLWQFFFEYDESTLSIAFTILIMGYFLGSFLVYLKFHFTMKKMKQSEKWANERSELIVVDTAFHQQKLTHSNLWFLISMSIALATIIMTMLLYDRFPDLIPMKYNFSGEAINWTEKSYQSVFMMPILQLFMLGLFLFINMMIAKSKQQISAVNPKQSTAQNIIFRRRWSAFLIIMGTALVLMFAFIQASMIFPINQQLIMVISLAITFGSVAGAIFLSITTGQGGSRVPIEEQGSGDIIDRDDDKYWKLGQFYFNKNDPAIFLEKRFGIGWTNNWAHPLSWVFIITILLLAIGLPILLTK